MELYKHEKAVAFSRDALRESVIFPLVRKTSGGIVEVYPTRRGEEPALKWFDDADEYVRRCQDSEEAPGKTDAVNQDIKLGIWLFGPEREEIPSRTYRMVSETLSPGGSIIVASEAPWPGKILATGEFGEYTTEETVASLIRSGFKDVESIIEGPFFRITRALRSPSDAHVALVEAERCLDQGDHANAELALNSITAQMDSAPMVREYALLIAACHDLAGRPEHALEALSEALTLDPRCARAMCGLGRIAALKGDLASSRDFFQSALRCEPALVAGLHGMAVIEEAEGNLKEAYRAMLTASDLRPKNSDLLSEAARLGNLTGEREDVARFISHRLGDTPQYPIAPDVTQGILSPEQVDSSTHNA